MWAVYLAVPISGFFLRFTPSSAWSREWERFAAAAGREHVTLDAMKID
jgi:hypothetical protein